MLRWRILLLLVSAVTVVFMSGAIFIYLNALQDRRMLVDGIQTHALRVSGSFEREVTSARSLLQGLSRSPALVSGDLAAFYLQLTRTPRPEGSWFVLWDMRGQVLNTLRPYGARLPQRSEIKASAQGFERVATRGYSISDRRIGPVSGVPSVSASIRLDGPDGQMTGALTVNLPQSRLDAVVEDVSELPGATTLLLDRHMAIAAAVGPDPIALPHFPPAVTDQLMQSPAHWSIMFQEPDGSRLVAVQHSDATDYTAVVAMPHSILDAPMQGALRQIAAVGICLLLAGLLAGMVASRQVESVASAAVLTARQLGLTQARYGSLWNDAPEGMFLVTVTQDGRFIYEGFNPAHERLTGLSFETVVGKEPKECLSPGDAAAVTDRYRACMAAGGPTVYDEVLDLPAGRRHWQTSLVPVRDPESDRIVALVGIARDMTEIAEARQNLRDISARLLSLQEEERQRIASELHDSTAQHIVAAGLGLMQVQKAAEDQAGIDEAIAAIRASLDEAQREIRTLSYLLYPPQLKSRGFEATLRSFVAGFADRTGLRARVWTDNDLKAPAELQGMILRVVQEALVNVHRHAEASRVSVILKRDGEALRVRIADDGRGMPETGTGGTVLGVGIPGMEARIRQFGGTMTISSSPAGTIIRAAIPLESEAEPMFPA